MQRSKNDITKGYSCMEFLILENFKLEKVLRKIEKTKVVYEDSVKYKCFKSLEEVGNER